MHLHWSSSNFCSPLSFADIVLAGDCLQTLSNDDELTMSQVPGQHCSNVSQALVVCVTAAVAEAAASVLPEIFIRLQSSLYFVLGCVANQKALTFVSVPLFANG